MTGAENVGYFLDISCRLFWFAGVHFGFLAQNRQKLQNPSKIKAFRGLPGAGLEPARPRGQGIRDAFDAFAASPERADVAGVTLEHYRSQFGRFVAWLRDARPEAEEMRQVTREDAALFLAHLDATASPNTRNKYLV
ncbi:MAG: hypothetical protein IJ783_01625, partial [Kiritimatiellae bacterium]|nr:hypothetical protein [Kiritimatiellia bacterium]